VNVALARGGAVAAGEGTVQVEPSAHPDKAIERQRVDRARERAK